MATEFKRIQERYGVDELNLRAFKTLVKQVGSRESECLPERLSELPESAA